MIEFDLQAISGESPLRWRCCWLNKTFKFPGKPLLLLVLVTIPGLVFGQTKNEVTNAPTVDFARDVLPILSDRCFLCHGPDENAREADLRLDVRDEALASGAITAGEPESSELMDRIVDDDADWQMPPPHSGKAVLNAEQVRILKQWISEGANYEKHWAFVKPKKAELPSITNETFVEWPKNPIDNFVFDRLAIADRVPSTKAEKTTLARRAALTLTGLPPQQIDLNAFLEDDSLKAYESYIDRLLNSAAYGERMASVWLDIARYSDTDGFQADEPRTNWPWRDWVINAYNSNMPFDQFTIEQFAGDLLDNATDNQIIATCFHRNHMTNGEGGRDPAESRVDYVLDRINTTGTAWLGLTLGCAQCHTHKYDPITQKEYYQLSAFFNSINEDGRAGKAAKPHLKFELPDKTTLLSEFESAVNLRKQELQALKKQAVSEFENWLAGTKRQIDELTVETKEATWNVVSWSQVSNSENKVEFDQEGDTGIWKITKGNTNTLSYNLVGTPDERTIGAIRLELLPDGSNTSGGLSTGDFGNICLTDFKAEVMTQLQAGESEITSLEIISAWADYQEIGFPASNAIDQSVDTGWSVLSGDMAQPRTLIVRLAEPIHLNTGDNLRIDLAWYSHKQRQFARRFRVSTSPQINSIHPSPVAEWIEELNQGDVEETSLSNQTEVKKKLLEWHLAHDSRIGLAESNLSVENKRLADATKKTSVDVMVLGELDQPRKSFVLERGVWDRHGEEVAPNTPSALNHLQADGDSPSRLDLAKWLVDPQNPLTARVAVNRYWMMHFGYGLVRTPEDFGLQGEYPTHPELLDWLAVEFIESGWDVRHIQKLIVTSATFQQSSKLSTELIELDPANRLLGRGPRFRLPASVIRDCALATSGLLTPSLGGPPVRPYQPDNVWASSDQGRYPYVTSSGQGLYRRSIYTYWRRNISPPGMFDSAQRRVCQVRVVRTNSPMHALNMLNDTTYVEAARVLAERVTKATGPQVQSRESLRFQINRMYRLVLCRNASEKEVELLSQSYANIFEAYQSSPEMASELLSVGESEPDESLDPTSLAALTIVASTILNLDETLNLE